MAITQWKRTSNPTVSRGYETSPLFDHFQDDWSRLFGWTRFPEAAGLFDRSSFPATDVVETEEGCTIWAEVPGLDKTEIDLSLAGNVLTIKGEKAGNVGKEKDSPRVYKDETWSGRFHRSLSLPDSVDPEKVSAEYRDGVLKVFVAKKKEHRPRQIPVKVR